MWQREAKRAKARKRCSRVCRLSWETVGPSTPTPTTLGRCCACSPSCCVLLFTHGLTVRSRRVCSNRRADQSDQALVSGCQMRERGRLGHHLSHRFKSNGHCVSSRQFHFFQQGFFYLFCEIFSFLTIFQRSLEVQKEISNVVVLLAKLTKRIIQVGDDYRRVPDNSKFKLQLNELQKAFINQIRVLHGKVVLFFFF